MQDKSEKKYILSYFLNWLIRIYEKKTVFITRENLFITVFLQKNVRKLIKKSENDFIQD